MSDPPHIIIIGAGSIGQRHLRCFQATKRCSLALCEPMSDRRDEVARKYGVNGYASWQEALERESFSAAIIASPAPWHIPTAQALSERGLDLLIEKPLSLTTEGISRLVDTIEQMRTRVAVGFVYRALPALQQMRAAVLDGEFGRIVQIQVQGGQHFPYYRPDYREIYYADRVQGGGLIQDMLPHSLNAVEWIAGPATRVVADACHHVLPGVEVEDTLNLLTRHGDVMASFTLNQHQPVNEFIITVLGDDGAARWELSGGRWLAATENNGNWSERAAFVHQRDDYYILQAGAFLDLLSGSGQALCPLNDGITTLKSTLAILESWQSGKWISVP